MLLFNVKCLPYITNKGSVQFVIDKTIFYFAKDSKTNNVAPFMETKVYRNTSDNQNPSDFQLLTPENGAILTNHGFLSYECQYRIKHPFFMDIINRSR